MSSKEQGVEMSESVFIDQQSEDHMTPQGYEFLLAQNEYIDTQEEPVFISPGRELFTHRYKLWKNCLDNLAIKTKGHELNVERVKQAFTYLLEHSETITIQPFDFIRMSHVYLVEGSLEGALQILNLASARGYMESTLIVLQTWSILNTLDMQREAQKYMNYLLSAIMKESISRNKYRRKDSVVYLGDSNLPLYHAFLHCAVYLKAQLPTVKKQSKAKRDKEMQHFIAVVSEAYYLAYGQASGDYSETMRWFNNAETWLEMGWTLENTSFMLLCEESYWQSFIRAPLRVEAIHAKVLSMEKYNRGDNVPTILAKAMEVNPWNTYCRDTLISHEKRLVSDAKQRQWAGLFENERVTLSHVQSVLRGWITRRRWPEYRARRMEILHAFHEMQNVSNRAYEKAVYTKTVDLFNRWRLYVYNWQWLKYNSATRIQAWYRRIWEMHCFRWTKWRISRANSLFIIAAQRQYDFALFRPLRHWHTLYMHRKKQQSAAVIIKVLQMNGYSKILANAMEFMLTVMRVPRRHLYKNIFTHWQKRLELRRINRSRVTIRFFIRGVYRRIRAKKLEAQMMANLAAMRELAANKAQEQAAADQQNQAIAQQGLTADEILRCSQLPKLREIWLKWRTVLNAVYMQRKKNNMSKQLARLFRRKQARRKLMDRRIRVEAQTAYMLSRWYHLVAGVFVLWKENAFTTRIQRLIRRRQAVKRLKRLQHIQIEIFQMAIRRKLAVLRKTFNRINKCIFLFRREDIRASRQIVRLFRIILHRAMLRRKVRRKIALFRLLDTMHRKHLALSFRNLGNITKQANNMSVLLCYFRVVRVAWLRNAFTMWTRQAAGQNLVTRLITTRVIRPLEKRYWIGAGNSIALRSLDNASVVHSRHSSDQVLPGEAASLCLTVAVSAAGAAAPATDDTPFDSGYKPWERYIRESKVLHSLSSYKQMHVFKTWMASYRLRNRFRRGSSTAIASRIVNGMVVQISQRRQAVLRMQCFVRNAAARIVFAGEVNLQRRLQECSQVVHVKYLHVKFTEMHKIVLRRSAARFRLQNFIRCSLAHKRCRRQHEHIRHLQVAGSKVASSQFQRNLANKYLSAWQLAFCLCVIRNKRHNSSSHLMSNTVKDKKATSKLAKKYYKNIQLSRSVSNKNILVMAVPPEGNPTRYLDELSDADRAEDEGDDVNDSRESGSRSSHHSSSKSRVQRNKLSTPDSTGTKHQLLRSKTADLAQLKSPVFLSPIFHQHLARLKQSGLFVYDSSAVVASVGGASVVNRPMEHARKPRRSITHSQSFLDARTVVSGGHTISMLNNSSSLLPEEVEYCLTNADAVFVQRVSKSALRNVGTHFLGDKVVLSGGYLAGDALINLMNIANKIAVEKKHSTVVYPSSDSYPHMVHLPPALLKLHFTAVSMRLFTKVQLCKHLAVACDTTISTTNTYSNTSGSSSSSCGDTVSPLKVQELSVDFESFGPIGLGMLMVAVETNTTVHTLVLRFPDKTNKRNHHSTNTNTNTNKDWKSFHGKCLIALSRNKTLRELRFFGTALDTEALESLRYAVRTGFSALISLEFNVDKESEAGGEGVLLTAKDRFASGGNGLSVIVNLVS